MLLADARTARVIVTVLLFALGLGFLYVTRDTLIAFLFAIFFAYLMSPLVANLEKVLKGRSRAIAVIYALLLALVVVFFVIVGPKVTREAARLGKSLPGLLEKAQFRRDYARTWARNTAGVGHRPTRCRVFWSATRTTSLRSRSESACAPPTSPNKLGCCLSSLCSQFFS